MSISKITIAIVNNNNNKPRGILRDHNKWIKFFIFEKVSNRNNNVPKTRPVMCMPGIRGVEKSELRWLLMLRVVIATMNPIAARNPCRRHVLI
jgi:hypothetical protein